MRKLRAVFSILFKDNLNYRAQAVVWIMTAVIPTMTTAYIWLAATGGSTVGQFNRAQLIVYFLGAIVLANITTSAIGFDMGREIKDGKLSFYLVRPLDYFSYQFLANLAWRIFRSAVFIPFLLIFGFFYFSDIKDVTLHLDALFWLLVLIGHLISFFIGFVIGSSALFFEDNGALGTMFILSNILLSGQLAPISLMPPALQLFASWMPFRFVMSVPLEYMVGHLQDITASVTQGIMWILVLFVMGQFVYRGGLKRYSAVGQ